MDRMSRSTSRLREGLGRHRRPPFLVQGQQRRLDGLLPEAAWIRRLVDETVFVPGRQPLSALGRSGWLAPQGQAGSPGSGPALGARSWGVSRR